MILLQFLAFLGLVFCALSGAAALMGGYYWMGILGLLVAFVSAVALARCEEHFNEELHQEMMSAAARVKPYWRR